MVPFGGKRKSQNQWGHGEWVFSYIVEYYYQLIESFWSSLTPSISISSGHIHWFSNSISANLGWGKFLDTNKALKVGH